MHIGLKHVLGLFVYLTTVAVVCTAVGMFLLSQKFSDKGPLQEDLLFTAERGQGVRTIADNLYKDGAITDALIFKISVKVLGADTQLKAGEYMIPAQASMRYILYMMREGKIHLRQFTVREGLTSFEIIRILNDVSELEGEIKETPKEGTLLPETYSYQLGDTKESEIAKMQKAMRKTLDELWPGRAANLPFTTQEEAVTLASIVEKETGIAEERKRVAGVFINRLRKNIALQTDPTVIYAITKGQHKNDGKGPLGRRLLSKDLELDSPYNTYKYPGLPPGPIANPGRASIEAVLNPEEHDFIYFVADGSGGHVFSSTLAEHNENVAKWRKIRRTKN